PFLITTTALHVASFVLNIVLDFTALRFFYGLNALQRQGNYENLRLLGKSSELKSNPICSLRGYHRRAGSNRSDPPALQCSGPYFDACIQSYGLVCRACSMETVVRQQHFSVDQQ
ncbi:hypothetical protein AAVH_27137, partial [Aphelenchoides avenae]